jgi:hypothetical protein
MRRKIEHFKTKKRGLVKSVTNLLSKFLILINPIGIEIRIIKININSSFVSFIDLKYTIIKVKSRKKKIKNMEIVKISRKLKKVAIILVGNSSAGNHKQAAKYNLEYLTLTKIEFSSIMKNYSLGILVQQNP